MLLLRLLWQIPTGLVLVVVVLLLINEYAIARPSRRTKDIAYVTMNASGVDAERHLLDVYTPRKVAASTKLPVVVFIHGGNWNSGNKNLYAFVGRRLAKQGVVAVIINYQLSPAVLVPAMANDCAQAVHWVSQHIAEFGGDPGRIFVMGHSAGGGLAALLATDDRLFARLGLATNPVKGAILDDAAGLDMFDYLTKMEYPNDQQYLIPYGKDPAVWRAVSPMYYVNDHTPPMLMYSGERTYPSITSSSQRFHQLLLNHQVKHEYKVLPGKKHIAMVTQLFWQHNIIYRELLDFVDAKKR
ncbi:alpha/beta hydrolase [Spirosoma radiotolerans]|uniref:Alpha/beta hydrolase n=1 Tax=Spirosoma radiotolerans TaxID=1379870 RepID=A0A0E4A0C7_9BACT|nr:alpha/beta hydrolase [Spirosoma radiotolerans]AKD58607.1 alpha/beta hydrolase [Spirosoma radiotolerans]